MNNEYDVVIVGGGPAGLSAAMMLGRCSRRVLLVDSGEYRNSVSKASHGFLTRDGTSPADLRRIGREQLVQYGVVVKPDQVMAARALQADERRPGENSGFILGLNATGAVRARKVILATGVVDVLPGIPGLMTVYGESVWTCPYCDAWEYRGKTLGVLGPNGADLAILLLTWSSDVIYFSNGTPVSIADEARLATLGIRTLRNAVQEIDSDTRGCRVWVNNTAIHRAAIFLKSEVRQRSRLSIQLGIREQSSEAIKHAHNGATTVPGLYIAGDMAQEHYFVVNAASEGASAGVAVHEEIHREDVRKGGVR